MTGADAIARRLAAAGCRFAFGIPGGEVLALIDSLSRAGLRVVTARHETAAGFMAEGTWHATGAPGVLVATLGPGVANAVNAVANAQQERVPLIVLTGCIDATDVGYTHQIFDHRAVLGPVTKATLTLSHDTVDELMAAGLELATADPPGPVHLDVPISVARGETREGSPSDPSSLPSGHTPSPDDRLLHDARGAIATAERPLVIAGLEVLFQKADAALAEFLRATGAPCITTYKAKGLVDETTAQSLGAAGLSPRADALLLPLVREADVVVLAGYDPIEMRRGWMRPFAETTRVIELASVPPIHGMHRATDLFLGDIAAHLRALSPGEGARRRSQSVHSAVRAALHHAFAPEREGFGPLAIAHALRTALPADAVVTVDTGAHRIAISQAFECRAPRTMLQSSALCTMGCAVPLAIGRKLAEPSRPVVAVVGDGGLDMTLGELATARDLGLGIVIVVVDDASLALIEMKQRAEGYPSVGVDTGRTRYADVAIALGGVGVVAKSATELVAAIRDGLARQDGFTLVHCPIGARAYDGRI